MKKISRRSEQAHSTKDKQIRFVGTCRKVPLVIISIIAVEKWSLWLRSVPSVGKVGYLVLGDRFDQRICALTDRPGPSYKKTEILLPQIDTHTKGFKWFLSLTSPENRFSSRVCSDPRSLAQPKWTWNWSNSNVLSPSGPLVSEAPLESAISSSGECPVFLNVPVTRPLALSKVIFSGLKLFLMVSLLTMFIGDCFRWPQSSYLSFQSGGPSTVINFKKRTHLKQTIFSV